MASTVLEKVHPAGFHACGKILKRRGLAVADARRGVSLPCA
jgi:hypothetical protein